MKLTDIERCYPRIAWRRPIIVQVGDLRRLCCRVCIVTAGLRAAELEDEGFESEGQFEQHMREHALAR
jgi:hypothetical protein